jgi:hypothetical protein
MDQKPICNATPARHVQSITCDAYPDGKPDLSGNPLVLHSMDNILSLYRSILTVLNDNCDELPNERPQIGRKVPA